MYTDSLPMCKSNRKWYEIPNTPVVSGLFQRDKPPGQYKCQYVNSDSLTGVQPNQILLISLRLVVYRI